MTGRINLRKKLGIALGSGSARGWAHIGVLNALDEEGLKVDYISGTSIGSVVGAVYSIGDMEAFEKFTRSIDWKGVVSLIDVTFPGTGLIPAKRVFKMLSEYYKDIKIEDLPIPYCAVAADVRTGEEVRFTKGRVSDAVRASVAIPGILTPHKYEGRVLVDGGIVNPVPVNVVRGMGADVVIAVDLNKCKVEQNIKPEIISDSDGIDKAVLKDYTEDERENRIFEVLEEKYKEFSGSIKARIDSFRSKDRIPNIMEIIDNTINIMQKSITENQFRIERPDIIIEPDLSDFKLFDFDRAEEAIEEGYRLTWQKVGDIKKLLK